MYLGDYTEDYATLNHKFTTRKDTGLPTTLSGTPVVKVYKGSATGTESTAGITLAVDFDSVTGLNNVLIDLSSDAFYAVGEDYAIVITTGTVNSISVVGEVVATFSIENRFDEVDVTKWLGTACKTPATAGVPKIDMELLFGVLLTEGGAGRLKAAFTKLFDVATPTLVASDVMRGTNSAALASVCTEVRLATLTDWINGGRLDLLLDAIQTDLDNGTDGLGALKTLIDTVNTDLSNGTDGLGALKTLIDTVNSDLANGTDGLGALKTLIDTVDTVVDSILVDTAVIGALGAGLTDLGGMSSTMKGQVNTEIDTALATTTYAEPAQGAPGATISLKDKIGFLYKFLRNRINQTATTTQIYNDDATTVDHKVVVSDDGTTAEKGEVSAGP